MDVQKDCTHESFSVESKVGRLTGDDGTSKIVEWRLDVTVHCTKCMKPFIFVGLPAGYSPNHPTMSIDGMEGRMVIKPIS